MIRIVQSADYWKNHDRIKDGAMPCVICGKGVTNPKYSVRVHNGGADIVTEEEAKTLNPASDMGTYPIGPDCLRKNPDIKPYVQ